MIGEGGARRPFTYQGIGRITTPPTLGTTKRVQFTLDLVTNLNLPTLDVSELFYNALLQEADRLQLDDVVLSVSGAAMEVVG